ncbi:MAG TPA: hypothetical protein VIV11_13370 [Kofleriaceae bacterium]
MQSEDSNSDQPTKTIARDALLGLIDQSTAPAIARAHTVSREQLRSRAVTRNEATTNGRSAEPEELLDTDISPSISPILVAAVILLLVVAFIAAAGVH